MFQSSTCFSVFFVHMKIEYLPRKLIVFECQRPQYGTYGTAYETRDLNFILSIQAMMVSKIKKMMQKQVMRNQYYSGFLKGLSQVWVLNKNALYLPQKFATYRASCHCLVNSLLTMGSWVAHIISYCIGYIRKCYFVFSSENVLHFCKLFCAIYTFFQPPFELLPSYEFD